MTLAIPQRLAVLKDNEGWFGRAPAAFQDAVLARCKWVTFRAGQPVYQATDPHINLCGIVEGAIEIYSRFGAGDNPLLHLKHEGHWVGYGTVVQRSMPRISAVARVETLMATVPDRQVREIVEGQPGWWEIIASSLMEYGDEAVTAYVDSLLRDHDRRCASILLRMSGLNPPRRSCPERADVPVTQHELATIAQLSRTTLAQVLQQFEARGLVQRGYRSLRITDEPGLRAVVQGMG